MSNKKTSIYNFLDCSEVDKMRAACECMGVKFQEQNNCLEVYGVDPKKLVFSNKSINAEGSGLVFRIFTALTCFAQQPSVLVADKTLQKRVMKDLFSSLKMLGANIECINEVDHAPIINWASPIKKGKVTLPGNISSQFITAILLAAPLANGPIEIEIYDELLSKSYIVQTITAMRSAGISIDVDDSFKYYKVYPGEYNAQDVKIKEDYTSASYLFLATALLPGNPTFVNVYGDSEQGEAEILDLFEEIGIKPVFNRMDNQLTLINENPELKGDYNFDVSNCPNITPTLAALGAYIQGKLRVTGASITRFHKAPRIKAMVMELKKLGVDIRMLYKNGYCDGFEVHGKRDYEGGVVFDSWKDHRVFMSLFIASLRTKNPCYLKGYEDVHCSFPNFIDIFKKSGVKMTETLGPEVCEA